MPKNDNLKEGHKFPFNACDLLSSDNTIIIERLMEETIVQDESDDDDEEEEKEDEDKENEDDGEKEKEEEKKETNNTAGEKEKKENENEDKNTEIKKNEANEKDNSVIQQEEQKKEQIIDEKKEEKDLNKDEENKKNESKNPEIEKDSKEANSQEENKNDKEDIKELSKNLENNCHITSNESPDKDDNTSNSHDDSVSHNENTKTKVEYYNLDYLFEFLNREKDCANDVLFSYFFKIFYRLVISESKKMVSYLFAPRRKEIIKNLLKNLTRKSSVDSIKVLLTLPALEAPDNYLDIKKEFCMELLGELNDCENNGEKCECITNIIKSSISDTPFFNFLMSSPDLLDMLFSILFKYLNQPWNLQCLLKLMINLNEKIIKAFPNKVTPNIVIETVVDYTNYEMKSALDEDKAFNSKNGEEFNLDENLKFLFKSLKESEFAFLDGLTYFSNENSQFPTTYQKYQKRLGLTKLTQVEYFRTILDILVNASATEKMKDEIDELITILHQKNMFWTLIDMFFTFEFNNMYQTLFNQIIEIVISSASPKQLVNCFFFEGVGQKRALTQALINHCFLNNKSQATSLKPTNSGFFPMEISILNTIMKSSNIYVEEISKNDKDLSVFIEVFAEQINNLFNQKLLSSETTEFTANLNSIQGTQVYSKEKTLEEMIIQNSEIYKTYKEGGNYLELIKIKKEEELKHLEEIQKEKSELAKSIPLSDENINEDDLYENVNQKFKEGELSMKDSHFFDSQKDDEVNEEDDLLKDITTEEGGQANETSNNSNEYLDNNYWASSINNVDPELIKTLLEG